MDTLLVYGNEISATEVAADAGRVAVLMGGPSAERAISLKSGAAVLSALGERGVDAVGLDWDGKLVDQLRTTPCDRVFNALHGRGGEDGTVQGLLEVMGLPYTGSGVLGSALAMDKLRAKRLWQAEGLPTPAFVAVDTTPESVERAAALGFPLAIKPVAEGSSLGVSKVASREGLEPAIAAAAAFGSVLLAERWVEGMEYTAAIVAGRCLPIIRIGTSREFYDFEAKYLADDTRYIIPCGLDATTDGRCRQLALDAFASLGAGGWGRVDFMVDSRGEPQLIELNTVPGMTDHSLVPMAAAAAGMSFSDVALTILATTLFATQVTT